MSMEAALVESRTLRASMCERVEVLDKVKILTVLPDGLHVTTRMVADYFEVSDKAIYSLVHRHRAELESNGYTVLKAVDNQEFVTLNMEGTQVSGRGTAIFNRRAVLYVAMLLRDSAVARAVRSTLVDTVEAIWRAQSEPEVLHFRARPWKKRSELRWDEYEATTRDPDAEAWRRRIDGQDPFEQPPTAEEERLGAIERRIDTQTEVIMAMGHRLCRHTDDLGAIRRDVAWLRAHGLS